LEREEADAPKGRKPPKKAKGATINSAHRQRDLLLEKGGREKIRKGKQQKAREGLRQEGEEAKQGTRSQLTQNAESETHSRKSRLASEATSGKSLLK